ncbi:MAG: hypothetical protein GXP17_03920 [Gammaproteobacteria bacterium]|nr:hypothetical protein [Gammaproteobacteria bacterium]
MKPGYSLSVLGLAAITLILASIVISKHSADQNWVHGWREVAGFQIPRRALAATSDGHYLYVVGGVGSDGRYVLPVEYAPIHADGSLGPWRQTSELREGRFYLAAVTHQGYVYALGGGGGPLGDDNVPLASVEHAAILADGSLGPWQHHSYLSTPRRGLKAALAGDQLYAIGGYSGQFLKSIERITLGADNPQWRQEPQQAQMDRYIHAAARHGQHLFLLGGHVKKAGSMSYGDVESALIGDNGALGPWSVAPSRLRQPRFIASAFALDDYLYLVGGHDGVNRLNSVEMAHVGSDGALGRWETLAPLRHQRSATAAAVVGNRVYMCGGIDNRGVLRSVEMAEPGHRGRLGHRRAENDAKHISLDERG